MIIPTFRIGDRSAYLPMAQCYEKYKIRQLRVNMVRHSMEVYCEEIAYFKSLIKTPLDIMADIPLPGRKYRLDLSNEVELTIQEGEEVYFTIEKSSVSDSSFIKSSFLENSSQTTIIPVQASSFMGVSKGDQIIIGDGELTLTVTEADAGKLEASANQTAVLRGQRSFAVPGSMSYQRYDSLLLQSYIQAFLHIKPTKIVLSFSEDVETLTEVKKELEKALGSVTIVPKIETQAGVDHCGELCIVFPEIMLGRGDLALFSNPVEFGKNQRHVIDTAHRKGVNVIAATDILSSLYSHNIPVRSDLSDVYYLYEMGVRDVVASAGISMLPEWFSGFCTYAQMFQA